MPGLRKLPPRYCAVCGMPLFRRTLRSGRREDVGDFLKRRTCSSRCWTALKTKPLRARRACLQCGAWIVRKRRPCGAIEQRSAFQGRRWCDRACRRLWVAEDRCRVSRGRSHSAAIRQSAKWQASVGRPRKPTLERRGSRTRCEWCAQRPAVKADILCGPCLRRHGPLNEHDHGDAAGGDSNRIRP
jgi:hypothetical protein